MKNRPAYAIESVDHALRLATVLQQDGPLGVSEAADLLGVSPSTAHRLLAMLVYRDFAEQGADRRYLAGAVLRQVDPLGLPVSRVREAALPHLRSLVAEVRETANLMVLAGAEARFVATAECDRVLRVGDRAGRALPAHLASGGKVLLAALSAGELAGRCADAGVDLPRLRRELGLVRRRGFAINDQLTETGVTAVGVAIPGHAGSPPVASLSLAVPTARFDRDRLPAWVAALSATARAVARELAEG